MINTVICYGLSNQDLTPTSALLTIFMILYVASRQYEFWKLWRSNFPRSGSSDHTIVNGLINASDMSDGFANYFGRVCQPNSDSYNDIKRSEYEKKSEQYFGDFLTPQDFFTVELVSKIISSLKQHRAAGIDGLTAEHLLHSHPSAILVINYLCNLMLISGYVPHDFLKGITFPIEKDKNSGKSLNFDEFRGITVSPLISKILEKCILENFSKYFVSSEKQFGFKKGVGCSHAIFCVRSTIDYYVAHSSSVNVCSLDIAKAFDKLNHYALFIKLMERSLPVNLILMLAYWYDNSIAYVCWRGAFSSPYHIRAGVRQGGCLSPILFAIFVNTVFSRLESFDIGCHLGFISSAVFMYADDLVLLSSSVEQLRNMIAICFSEFAELDLQVNPKKSACLRFGDQCTSQLPNITVNNCIIPWENQLRYLGIVFASSKKFSVDLKHIRCKFYSSFNALYSKIYNANEHMITSLVKSICIPTMVYSLNALNFKPSELSSLDKPLLHAFAKIFKTYDQNCLSSCMYYMNILPIKFEYYKLKLNFLNNLPNSDNILLRSWYSAIGCNELSELCRHLNVENGYVNSAEIVWKNFAASVLS